MSEVLLVYLESSKNCSGCWKSIAAGEKAIRKAYKETKKSKGWSEYFHETCWRGK